MKVTRRYRYVVEDADRHGNVRVYLRLPGRPKRRMGCTPGTPEFDAEYRRAIAGELPTKPKRLAAPPVGSLHALCVAYYQSDQFNLMNPRSRRVRRLILDRLCEAHGHRLATEMGAQQVRAVRGSIETPEAANSVKALRAAFAAGIEAGLVGHNPAKDVRLLPSKRPGGIPAWSAADVQRFEAHHAIGTQARLALSLLIYTGQRRSDVVRFGPAMVLGETLRFTQVKNGQRKPVALVLPIRPELRAILAATQLGPLTFLVSELGRSFTAEGFGNRFRKWCDEAGLPGRSAHGLRKTAANELAQAGATENEIKAAGGWKTSKQVSHYTAAASQEQLAAAGFAKLAGGKVSHSDAQSAVRDESAPQVCDKKGEVKWMVPRGGIEPPTLRFSVACSTN